MDRLGRQGELGSLVLLELPARQEPLVKLGRRELLEPLVAMETLALLARQGSLEEQDAMVAQEPPAVTVPLEPRARREQRVRQGDRESADTEGTKGKRGQRAQQGQRVVGARPGQQAE